ncbi:MAG: tRNA (guanine-N(7)-)-methyltransferase [Chlamydiia bacterium]|nr:tRNA (guanine-N(7)-)-methyltransferase [Chlamydiia bacterium]
MRPKDLEFTIKGFETRKPSFSDGVLTIPSYFEKHDRNLFPELNTKLERYQTIHVEICSGNGEWIAERAQKNPEILYFAVEKKFMRIRKIWSKMKNKGLENLIIVSGMGEDFLDHYLDRESIDEVFVNFPDPWPKKRHAKHRIIKESFLKPVYDVLKADGQITTTTDSKEYSEEMIEVFSASDLFNNLYPNGFTPLDESYGGSYFKRLWSEMGRKNRLMTFKKVEKELCASPKI